MDQGDRRYGMNQQPHWPSQEPGRRSVALPINAIPGLYESEPFMLMRPRRQQEEERDRLRREAIATDQWGNSNSYSMQTSLQNRPDIRQGYWQRSFMSQAQMEAGADHLNHPPLLHRQDRQVESSYAAQTTQFYQRGQQPTSQQGSHAGNAGQSHRFQFPCPTRQVNVPGVTQNRLNMHPMWQSGMQQQFSLVGRSNASGFGNQQRGVPTGGHDARAQQSSLQQRETVDTTEGNQPVPLKDTAQPKAMQVSVIKSVRQAREESEAQKTVQPHGKVGTAAVQQASPSRLFSAQSVVQQGNTVVAGSRSVPHTQQDNLGVEPAVAQQASPSRLFAAQPVVPQGNPTEAGSRSLHHTYQDNIGVEPAVAPQASPSRLVLAQAVVQQGNPIVPDSRSLPHTQQKQLGAEPAGAQQASPSRMLSAQPVVQQGNLVPAEGISLPCAQQDDHTTSGAKSANPEYNVQNIQQHIKVVAESFSKMRMLLVNDIIGPRDNAMSLFFKAVNYGLNYGLSECSQCGNREVSLVNTLEPDELEGNFRESPTGLLERVQTPCSSCSNLDPLQSKATTVPTSAIGTSSSRPPTSSIKKGSDLNRTDARRTVRLDQSVLNTSERAELPSEVSQRESSTNPKVAIAPLPSQRVQIVSDQSVTSPLHMLSDVRPRGGTVSKSSAQVREESTNQNETQSNSENLIPLAISSQEYACHKAEALLAPFNCTLPASQPVSRRGETSARASTYQPAVSPISMDGRDETEDPVEEISQDLNDDATPKSGEACSTIKNGGLPQIVNNGNTTNVPESCQSSVTILTHEDSHQLVEGLEKTFRTSQPSQSAIISYSQANSSTSDQSSSQGIARTRHKTSVHKPTDVGPCSSSPGKFSCKLCEFTANTILSLQEHVNSHGSFQCVQCDQEFQTNKLLQSHIFFLHTHTCWRCSESFETNDELNDHVCKWLLVKYGYQRKNVPNKRTDTANENPCKEKNSSAKQRENNVRKVSPEEQVESLDLSMKSRNAVAPSSTKNDLNMPEGATKSPEDSDSGDSLSETDQTHTVDTAFVTRETGARKERVLPAYPPGRTIEGIAPALTRNNLNVQTLDAINCNKKSINKRKVSRQDMRIGRTMSKTQESSSNIEQIASENLPDQGTLTAPQSPTNTNLNRQAVDDGSSDTKNIRKQKVDPQDVMHTAHKTSVAKETDRKEQGVSVDQHVRSTETESLTSTHENLNWEAADANCSSTKLVNEHEVSQDNDTNSAHFTSGSKETDTCEEQMVSLDLHVQSIETVTLTSTTNVLNMQAVGSINSNTPNITEQEVAHADDIGNTCTQVEPYHRSATYMCESVEQINERCKMGSAKRKIAQPMRVAKDLNLKEEGEDNMFQGFRTSISSQAKFVLTRKFVTNEQGSFREMWYVQNDTDTESGLETDRLNAQKNSLLRDADCHENTTVSETSRDFSDQAETSQKYVEEHNEGGAFTHVILPKERNETCVALNCESILNVSNYGKLVENKGSPSMSGKCELKQAEQAKSVQIPESSTVISENRLDLTVMVVPHEEDPGQSDAAEMPPHVEPESRSVSRSVTDLTPQGSDTKQSNCDDGNEKIKNRDVNKNCSPRKFTKNVKKLQAYKKIYLFHQRNVKRLRNRQGKSKYNAYTAQIKEGAVRVMVFKKRTVGKDYKRASVNSGDEERGNSSNVIPLSFASLASKEMRPSDEPIVFAGEREQRTSSMDKISISDQGTKEQPRGDTSKLQHIVHGYRTEKSEERSPPEVHCSDNDDDTDHLSDTCINNSLQMGNCACGEVDSLNKRLNMLVLDQKDGPIQLDTCGLDDDENVNKIQKNNNSSKSDCEQDKRQRVRSISSEEFASDDTHLCESVPRNAEEGITDEMPRGGITKNLSQDEIVSATSPALEEHQAETSSLISHTRKNKTPEITNVFSDRANTRHIPCGSTNEDVENQLTTQFSPKKTERKNSRTSRTDLNLGEHKTATTDLFHGSTVYSKKRGERLGPSVSGNSPRYHLRTRRKVTYAPTRKAKDDDDIEQKQSKKGEDEKAQVEQSDDETESSDNESEFKMRSEDDDETESSESESEFKTRAKKESKTDDTPLRVINAGRRQPPSHRHRQFTGGMRQECNVSRISRTTTADGVERVTIQNKSWDMKPVLVKISRCPIPPGGRLRGITSIPNCDRNIFKLLESRGVTVQAQGCVQSDVKTECDVESDVKSECDVEPQGHAVQ